MQDFSAIVVTRDRPTRFARALASLEKLQRATPKLKKIIVVDNASETPVVHSPNPLIEIVRNEEPQGVAYNRNEGWRHADTEFVLFLDDDAYIEDVDLASIAEFAQAHPDAAIIAPRILYPNGTLQESVRSFPSMRALIWRGLRLYRLGQPSWYRTYVVPIEGRETLAEPCEIDWAIGACLIIRSSAAREAGYFDTGYVFGYEDADLALRLKRRGLGVWYWPAATIAHEYTRSSAKLFNVAGMRHLRSIMRFFLKNYLLRSRA